VTDYIYENRKHFAGIALLPTSGDLDYPQAPMCTVHTAKEIVSQYGEGSLFASGLIVDGLRAFDNNLWAACDAVMEEVKPHEERMGPDQPSRTAAPEGDQFSVDFVAFREWKEAHDKWKEQKDFVRRAIQFSERYFDNKVKKMTYCLKK
jgi:ribonucleoside-diphosphate reductase alpha chain